jgi:hypothetical protein
VPRYRDCFATLAMTNRVMQRFFMGVALRGYSTYCENMEMKLLRTKVWSVLDIGLLKWSCILIGMIVGSYLSAFTKRHVRLFIIAAILLAIKPATSYFRSDVG